MPVIDPHAAARSIVVLILIGLFAWGMFESRASAQGQQSLRDWFNSLKSPAGGVCCHNFDGISLEEADWRSGPNGYQVVANGKWIDVPPDTVVNEPNRLGRAHLWLKHDGSVRCFIPGALT